MCRELSSAAIEAIFAESAAVRRAELALANTMMAASVVM
jgi:hypothetical protein